MSIDGKILALAFKNRKFAMELAGCTHEKYFSPDTRWVYNALMHYFNDPNIKDIPTKNMIEEYASDRADKDKCIEQYDKVLADHSDTQDGEFKWLLEKLRFRYNNQIQIEINTKISQLFKEQQPSKERVEEVNKALKESVVDIDNIHKRTTYKEGTLKESAPERIKRYQFIKANPDAARGIYTGFSSLDKRTNGIHRGEFVIIAGDTGTGKSIVMHNIGVNAYLGNNDPFDPNKNWHGGNNILYFSLEMPKESMERRIDACMAEIYANHIRDGLLNDTDELQYFRILKFQEEYEKHFHIVDMPKGATTREIELKYLEILESGWKPDLVIVDYMGIMSANNPTGSDWMDLGIISAELHEFARVYEIAVITGSQVNRSKDGSEKYDTSRIARSSMIPNNANVVLQIANRPDEYIRTDMQIYVIKIRDGEKGDPFTLSKEFNKMKVRDILDETYDSSDDEEII